MRRFTFQEYEKLTRRGTLVSLVIVSRTDDQDKKDIVEVIDHKVISSSGLAVQVNNEHAFEDETCFMVLAGKSEVRSSKGSLFGDLMFILPEENEDEIPINKITAKKWKDFADRGSNPRIIITMHDGTVYHVNGDRVDLIFGKYLSIEEAQLSGGEGTITGLIVNLLTGEVIDFLTRESVGYASYQLSTRRMYVITFGYKMSDGRWTRYNLGDTFCEHQPQDRALTYITGDLEDRGEPADETLIKDIRCVLIDEWEELC